MIELFGVAMHTWALSFAGVGPVVTRYLLTGETKGIQT